MCILTAQFLEKFSYVYSCQALSEEDQTKIKYHPVEIRLEELTKIYYCLFQRETISVRNVFKKLSIVNQLK